MDILPALRTGALTVVCAPHAASHEISALAAQLALRGPLTLLDGGNCLQPYRIASLLRRCTLDVDAAARRLYIRRAFTCYQMLALLENTPSLRQPCVVLDLLASFYDEHVTTPEACRLLEACLRQIERLCQTAPLAVTLAPPPLAGRAFLLEQVCARAGQLFTLETPAPQVTQPPLFVF